MGMVDRTLKIYQADAFTAEPFSGNPAAVCLVNERTETDALMQKVAMEMNLAETAFLQHASGKSYHDDRFNLRWFTPSIEVNLCGHATLATAAVLFYELGNPHDVIRFDTLSGELVATRVGSRIELSLPLHPPAPIIKSDTPGLYTLAKRIAKAACDISIYDMEYSRATKKLLLRLPDTTTREELEQLPIQPSLLMDVPDNDGVVKGVMITVKAQPGSGGGDDSSTYDFFSRYFAPWVAIPEDSVTGSAHTVLSAYWASVYGKQELHSRQCSARGGDLWLRTHTDAARLFISGPGKVVLRGEIVVGTA